MFDPESGPGFAFRLQHTFCFFECCVAMLPQISDRQLDRGVWDNAGSFKGFSLRGLVSILTNRKLAAAF